MNKSILIVLLSVLSPLAFAADGPEPGGFLTREARSEGYNNYMLLFESPEVQNATVTRFGPTARENQSPGDTYASSVVYMASPDPDGLKNAPVSSSKKVTWRMAHTGTSVSGQDPFFDFSGSGIYENLY